jgi:hypothetical protein
MKHIKELRKNNFGVNKEAKRAFENFYKLAHVLAKLKSFTSSINWCNNKNIDTSNG